MDDNAYNKLQDKIFLATKKNRQENTDILLKKLDELKPAIAETSAKDFLDKLASNFKGEKGNSPTEEELLQLIKPLIPSPIAGKDGIDGQTPTKSELQALIAPLIPEPIVGSQGLPGQDSSVVGPRGPKGNSGKDGSPDTGQMIVDKLSRLIGDNKLDITALKGLDKLEQSLSNSFLSQAKSFIPKSLSALYDVNLNGLADGQTLVYNKASQKWLPGTAVAAISGAGFTSLPATGAVDGANTIFTFTQKPTYIISDHAWYKENVGWSWNNSILTATLNVPPVDEIYGFV